MSNRQPKKNLGLVSSSRQKIKLPEMRHSKLRELKLKRSNLSVKLPKRNEFASKRRSKTSKRENNSAIKNCKRQKSRRLSDLKRSCVLKKKSWRENCVRKLCLKPSKRRKKRLTKLQSANRSCLLSVRSKES